MTIINVTCTDQLLTASARPVIASGGVEVDRVSFSFCPKWDGTVKTAVFYRRADEVYHVLLDGNNECCIPKEVLCDPGLLYIGVFGVRGDTVIRPSTVLTYNVAQGAITSATAVPDPTPDIYAQLLGHIGDLDRLKTMDKSNLVSAINEIYATGGGGGGGGMSFELDETLYLKNGVLGVNTTGDVEGNNTLPITSAAVHKTVGNIEILLKTI